LSGKQRQVQPRGNGAIPLDVPFAQQAAQLAAPAGQQQLPAPLRQPGGLPLDLPIGFEVQPRQKKPQNLLGRFGSAAFDFR